VAPWKKRNRPSRRAFASGSGIQNVSRGMWFVGGGRGAVRKMTSEKRGKRAVFLYLSKSLNRLYEGAAIKGGKGSRAPKHQLG